MLHDPAIEAARAAGVPLSVYLAEQRKRRMSSQIVRQTAVQEKPKRTITDVETDGDRTAEIKRLFRPEFIVSARAAERKRKRLEDKERKRQEAQEQRRADIEERKRKIAEKQELERSRQRQMSDEQKRQRFRLSWINMVAIAMERERLGYIGKTRLADIIEQVSDKYKCSVTLIKSAQRNKKICIPRFEFFWRSRNETEHSLPTIGRFCGGKDHTTVIHAIRRYEQLQRAKAGLEPWPKHHEEFADLIIPMEGNDNG